MDHHQSHLHQPVRVGFLFLLAWMCGALAQASAQASSFAELAQVTNKHLGFSVGVPNLIEPVLQLDHAAGLSSEARAIVAPLPLGSLATYVYSHFEVQLRYWPSQKALKDDAVFSIASGVGFQSVSLSLPLRLGNLASEMTQASTTAGFQSFYWTVSVGWHWTWISGFRLGLGASIRVPIIGWGGIAANSGTSASSAASFYQSSLYPMARIASLVHPSLQLIELSWRF